jgi:hypothetical protein
MIYVDPATFRKPNGRKFYGHMVGTTVEELKIFAESIGVKRHFWHSQQALSHFDINSDQRQTALQHGAIEVSSKELASLARLMNS